MAQLDQYRGGWTDVEAAHLLRRCCFGFRIDQLENAVRDGLEKTVDALLTPLPEPALPIDPLTGETFTDKPFSPVNNGRYTGLVKAWWAEQVVAAPPSLQEKMTLFWMSHFVIEATAVQSYVFFHDYLAFLRKNALGDVRTMARWITTSGAMLRYLNGNVNTAGNPNENFARELQELFINGKGPEIEAGNYTTYTESDVREAARVLTGWREQRGTGVVSFDVRRHDVRNKQFSAAYNNTVIRGRNTVAAGEEELGELLDMIFAQEATERFVIRKIYRWLVNADVTPTVERDVIAPLGKAFRAAEWRILPVLRTLLLSEHFHDAAMHGSQLKSPADFIFGTMRSHPTFRLPADATQRYTLTQNLSVNLRNFQMELGDPPSVAGYDAMHQQPDYDRLWINTATLPLRNGWTDAIVAGTRQRQGAFDTIAMVDSLPNASDPYAMMDALCKHLFAVEIAEDMRQKLLQDVLQEGGMVYDWTTEWQAYKAAPTNQQLRTRMKTKLDRLFVYLFRMAEYQLI
jgi:uncharacterized protein (DUF1800 family)